MSSDRAPPKGGTILSGQKHHRRSMRMPGYDYSQPGAYFVTISTHRHECILGEIVDGQMCLSKEGEVVRHHWQGIPRRSAHVRLDAWMIMPNHVHGILVLVEPSAVGARHSQTGPSVGDGPSVSLQGVSKSQRMANASPLRARSLGAARSSLGAIIGSFKSVSARRINRILKTPGRRVWQRNYYERVPLRKLRGLPSVVIRNERELHAIQQYIRDNPLKWELDRENPEGSGFGRRRR